MNAMNATAEAKPKEMSGAEIMFVLDKIDEWVALGVAVEGLLKKQPEGKLELKYVPTCPMPYCVTYKRDRREPRVSWAATLVEAVSVLVAEVNSME